MDRRQLVVQRARDYFGERVDDVLHMVRQDRQEMRGWEEPAHVRAAARRAVREGGGDGNSNTTTTTARALAQVSEAGRAAGEPDRGQQREAFGQVLEAGAFALEKVARNAGNDLNADEVFGLECVLLLYGRPAVLVSDGSMSSPPPFWNQLEDVREDIEMAQRGVGRIEMLGHPEYDWAGTGFLVSEEVLLTTRRIAEQFGEAAGNDNWQFRPGITAWMEYRAPYQSVSSAGYRVRRVIGVHDRYDLALLEVERPQINGAAPTPLSLAARPPQRFDGRAVYLVGYPVRDARRNEPEAVARVFRDVYNVKRVQPGVLRGNFSFHQVEFLRHDCAPLGQTAGAPIIDLETQQVLAVQTTGRYLETSTAVPLYALRDDPLLRQAGVTFADTSPQERQNVLDQIDRLARTRFWNEARSVIANLYQRAFGTPAPNPNANR
jgi:hypothetical protein